MPASTNPLDITLLAAKKKELPYLINQIKSKNENLKSPKYCFLLGAGTSVTANIPPGGGLTEYLRKRCFLNDNHSGYSPADISYSAIDKYLEEHQLKADYEAYKQQQETNFQQQIDSDRNTHIESLPDVLKKQVDDLADAGWEAIKETVYQSNYYGLWFDEFSQSPRSRQELIEQLIDTKIPSAGYILLAKLVEKDVVRHFFTTNFDDLVHDALFAEADLKARVFAHNELAHFINFDSRRPNIIKLHGDYLYQNIRNTVDETAGFGESNRNKFLEAGSRLGMVIFGYSGSDKSVMDALDEVKARYRGDFSVIWCGRGEQSLHWRAKHFINTTPNSFYVNITSFDDVMVELFTKCGCDLKPLEERIKKANADDEKVRNLLRQNTSPNREFDQTLSLNEALSKAYNESDITKRLGLLDSIVHRFSGQSEAYFYRGISKNEHQDYAGAVADYSQAIKLRPDYASAYNNRGNSKRLQGRFDEAAVDVEKAIMLDPNNGFTYSTIAEIQAQLGDEVRFYENIERAFRLGCPVWQFLDDPAYDAYRDAPRFVALLNQYRSQAEGDAT